VHAVFKFENSKSGGVIALLTRQSEKSLETGGVVFHISENGNEGGGEPSQVQYHWHTAHPTRAHGIKLSCAIASDYDRWRHATSCVNQDKSSRALK
jgi:hypothetical protein